MLRGRAQQERELRLPGTALQLLADLAQGIGHAGQGGERLLHTAMHVRAQFGGAAFKPPGLQLQAADPHRGGDGGPFDGAAPRSGHGARATDQRYIPAWCDIGASLDLAALFSGHVMGPPGWNPADPDDPRRSGGLQRAQEGLHTGDVGSRRAHARLVSAGGMPAHGVHGACVRAGNIPGRHVRARDRMDLHVIGAGAQRYPIVSLHQGPAVGCARQP